MQNDQIRHVCPICNTENSPEEFQEHLGTHFKQQANGALTPLYKVGSSPSKEIVEGMCVEALTEAYKSLSVTANDQHRKLTKEESFLAALHITIGHLTTVTECLGPLQAAVLAPKHRMLKRVTKLWLQDLAQHYHTCVTQPTDDNFKDAARALLTVISDFHTILKEDTPHKQRKDIMVSTLAYLDEPS